MLMLAGTFRVPPEKLGEAEPHMAAVIEASGREEGCLYFAFGYDVLEPGLVNVMELWRDQAALDAHRETAHFQAYLARIGDLAERTAFALAPVGVRPDA